MPNLRKKEQIRCQFFIWLLGRRGTVFFADGRGNSPPLGRHSLGTKDRSDALTALKELDHIKAIELGRVSKEMPCSIIVASLELAAGWSQYLAHMTRPQITGGSRPGTVKRYRAVYDKFVKFAESVGIRFWNQVSRKTLERYAMHLEGQGYAPRTVYLELITLKQAVKWFTEEGHLPPECRVKMHVRRPSGTDTYCWKPEEVQAITDHCRSKPDLSWLGEIVMALASTGLRISELAGLRWGDIDFETNMVHLTDEASRAHKRSGKARELKNHRSRSFPISPELKPVLEQIPRKGDGLVFHGPRGGKVKPDVVRTILIRDVLKPLADRYPTPEGEIGFADGRLHSFRHYFCSASANAGVPERIVMQWLGHRDSAMVAHYYHLHDDEAQRQMKKLSFVTTVSDSAGG